MAKHYRDERDITQLVTDILDITIGVVTFVIAPTLIVVAIIAALIHAL